MKKVIIKAIEESIAVKRQCLENNVVALNRAVEVIIEALSNGHKIMICGNGGSAADSQHIAAEFVGRFYRDRKPLAAMALTTDSSVLTCVANDYSYADVFSRQVTALGQTGDVLWGISTSGQSQNVIRAFSAARESSIKTIGLTGRDGGEIARLSDVSIVVPARDTARIQEAHICLSHIICQCVEDHFFPADKNA